MWIYFLRSSKRLWCFLVDYFSLLDSGINCTNNCQRQGFHALPTCMAISLLHRGSPESSRIEESRLKTNEFNRIGEVTVWNMISHVRTRTCFVFLYRVVGLKNKPDPSRNRTREQPGRLNRLVASPGYSISCSHINMARTGMLRYAEKCNVSDVEWPICAFSECIKIRETQQWKFEQILIIH